MGVGGSVEAQARVEADAKVTFPTVFPDSGHATPGVHPTT